MEDLEERALSLSPIKPRLYKRYVEEISGWLPFLDLLISRPIWAKSFTKTPTRPFYLEVYRKPTHGNRYIHFHSAHPYTLKRNVLRGLWLRAKRLLRHHPKQLKLELNHLKRTFIHSDNAYPPVVINRWFHQFERQLMKNPSLINLPSRKKSQAQPGRKGGNVSDQSAPFGTKQVDRSDNLDSQNVEEEIVGTPWVPTLFSPYVPGVSERMRSLASKYGVRSWFSFSGKLAEKLCKFKDHLHQSKSQFSVYSVSCNCGVRYVGESARNLKVRVHEHQLRSSKSAITLHVNESNEAENTDDHGIETKATLVLSQEKNRRKRRFMESISIKAKALRLCNTGPSAYVSDVWNPALPRIAESFPSAMDSLD